MALIYKEGTGISKGLENRELTDAERVCRENNMTGHLFGIMIYNPDNGKEFIAIKPEDYKKGFTFKDYMVKIQRP